MWKNPPLKDFFPYILGFSANRRLLASAIGFSHATGQSAASVLTHCLHVFQPCATGQTLRCASNNRQARSIHQMDKYADAKIGPITIINGDIGIEQIELFPGASNTTFKLHTKKGASMKCYSAACSAKMGKFIVRFRDGS